MTKKPIGWESRFLGKRMWQGGGKLSNKNHIFEDLGAVAQNALDQVVGHCAPRLSNIFNATATLRHFKSRQAICGC